MICPRESPVNAEMFAYPCFGVCGRPQACKSVMSMGYRGCSSKRQIPGIDFKQALVCA